MKMNDDQSANEFPAAVSPAVAEEYAAQKMALVDFVNRAMDADRDVAALTGDNPRQVMYTNHSNHAEFMANVLQFSQFELLARILPWVYNAYHAHGFSYDYFPRALSCWMDAVRALLSPAAQAPVLEVYAWMRDRHSTTVEQAEQAPTPPIASLDGRWQEVRTAYLEAVVAGDTCQARATAEAAVHGLDDMRDFYLEVLQPVMVDIGRLWQRGEISVAQEHLATAIAGRIMASFYVRFMNRKPTKGAAVITAAPNEFHELGARMIADFLEIDGWDTAFLGADTPAEDLIQLLRGGKHELLGISVMMPFNLDKVGSLIAAIRAIPELAALKIMVGGGSLNLMPGLKDALRADGFAVNAATAVTLANQWREGK